MSIIRIEAQKLRRMENNEGLVIQGCGGDLQEWVDGINDMLTEAGILINGSRFENCYAFENENLTCILFPFEDVQLEMGKLAMWRLQTHEQFGGTWLSDYVPNRLGGFTAENEQVQKKPNCPLIGQNGNIFVKRHVKHKKRENPKKAVKKQNTPYKLRIYGVYEV